MLRRRNKKIISNEQMEINKIFEDLQERYPTGELVTRDFAREIGSTLTNFGQKRREGYVPCPVIKRIGTTNFYGVSYEMAEYIYKERMKAKSFLK